VTFLSDIDRFDFKTFELCPGERDVQGEKESDKVGISGSFCGRRLRSGNEENTLVKYQEREYFYRHL
jgi:hypothetical protein